MANCMIGFPNQIDSATLSGGSFVGTMPLSKVQGRRIKDVARTVDTQRTNTWIGIDQKKPVPAHAMAIINHNFSLDARYRIRGTNEAPGRNILVASERFDAHGWGAYRVAAYPNRAIAPSGKRTATKLVAEVRGVTTHYIEQTPTIDASKTYTRSWYIKQGEMHTVRFEIFSRPTTAKHAAFNFDSRTGTFNSASAREGATQRLSAEKLPGGWWRVSQTFNLGGTDTSCYCRIALLDQNRLVTSFERLSGHGIYMWGAQLELGDKATSYFETRPEFSSRDSIGMYYDVNFNLLTANANVPRYSHDPEDSAAGPFMLIERGANNLIRNNTMVGAIRGVIGSGGQIPNRWHIDASAGQSIEIVDIQTNIDGFAFLDVRFFSASNDRGYSAIYFEPSNGSGITNSTGGQVFAASAYFKLVAGKAAPGNWLYIRSISIFGIEIGAYGTAFTPADSNTPLAQGRVSTVSNPAPEVPTRLTAFYLAQNLPIGQPYDFTIRIALPQVEFNQVTMPIRTSDAVGYRGPDLATYQQDRPAGYMDDWQDYGYSSGWQDVWPAVYPYGTKEWEDPSWWGGKYSQEEIAGYTPSLIHLMDGVKLVRYWRVDIDDTANADGYLQFGRMFVGPTWQPGINMSYGASLALETDTDVQKSQGGAESFDVRTPYRVQRYRLDNLTKDEAMANVFELQRRAGIDKEVLWISDPEDKVHAIRNRFLGRLRTLSPIEFPYFNTNATAFEIKEIQ